MEEGVEAEYEVGKIVGFEHKWIGVDPNHVVRSIGVMDTLDFNSNTCGIDPVYELPYVVGCHLRGFSEELARIGAVVAPGAFARICFVVAPGEIARMGVVVAPAVVPAVVAPAVVAPAFDFTPPPAPRRTPSLDEAHYNQRQGITLEVSAHL